MHWGGLAIFGGGFRRMLFCIFQEFFRQVLTLEGKPARPWHESIDEVCSFMILIAFCRTNLLAPIQRLLSCTDASPSGGGSAETKYFKDILEQPSVSRLEKH